jgi:hypothetical protein
MRLLGRIIVIIFAVMLASIASGIATAVLLLGPGWHGFSGDFGERFVFWGTAFIGTSFTGAIGLLPLPLAILIALSEALKIRSLLVYAATGAVIMTLGYYSSGRYRPYEESIDHSPPPISREAEIAAAAGVVFGLAYWAIAGRKAGAWRG